MTGRHTDWVFTIYRGREKQKWPITEKVVGEFWEMWRALETKCTNYKHLQYAIAGVEVCPETQHLHIQGYIAFKNSNAKSRSALQKWSNKWKIKHYCDVRKGTPEQARNYCWKGPMKHGTPEPHEMAVYWQVGELPCGQGKRTDIIICKEALENGQNMRGIIRDARSNQVIRFAQNWLTALEQQRSWKPTVIYLYGSTGCGKSRFASFYAKKERTYWCNETNKWWDGYDAHPVVIIDDMRQGWCRFETMLRILDRYPHRVEVKGGYRQLLAKTIIVTSNLHPKILYDIAEESYTKLKRRIKWILPMDRIHAEKLKLFAEIQNYSKVKLQ